MIRTYQGYFKDGRFMPSELGTVKIPEEIEVYVMVTGRKLTTKGATTTTQTNESEIAKRLEMVKSITGILPPNVNLEAAREERITKRGLL